MVEYDDVIRAHKRLKHYLKPTLMEPAPALGPAVWLKLENTNLTHSFKIRGAMNAVLALDSRARQRGIVTASSGNHAQGLAYAARMAQIPARILMPQHTPKRKIMGVQRSGAEAVLFGSNYDETELEARRLERDDGLTYISPYNDVDVVAGAGTIGLEILEQVPDVERVVVCVGGGGLISGIATAVKALRSDIEVIGVNAQSAPTMYNAFYDTNYPEVWETLAEALSGGIEDGSITLEVARQLVDRIVLASEDDIAAAMRWMMSEQGWLVEGGGAVAVAAMLSGTIDHDEKPTVVLVSGSNIDHETLAQVMCKAKA